MFTGIITGVGRIAAVHDLGRSLDHGKRLEISTPAHYLDDVSLGDSIALNGACMTVTSFNTEQNLFTIDISAESLDKTALLNVIGTTLNLEKALRPNDRLGGHIVSGHVDGVGQVALFELVGESWLLQVLAPPLLAKYLAYKGSITVNGVSLTVNRIEDKADGCLVFINLIPHTIEHTALGSLKPGSPVNLEIDTVARYVERMLQFDSPRPSHQKADA
jgi:riboflavin synthase